MYLETMQQIFASATKVMVDAKTGSNLLYLPLDKLIQQAPPPAPRRQGAGIAAGSPRRARRPPLDRRK
jgi:membrane protease subunit HflK